LFLQQKTVLIYKKYSKVKMKECLLCYDSKNNQEFLSNQACMHNDKICIECLSKLQSRKCPYCQETLYNKSLTTIYEAIYVWIAIIEQDIPLLDALITKWNVDISKMMPFDIVIEMLTGKASAAEAEQWWNNNPHRKAMKKTYLQINNIVYNEELETYQEL
jgi:hypothetical protein